MNDLESRRKLYRSFLHRSGEGKAFASLATLAFASMTARGVIGYCLRLALHVSGRYRDFLPKTSPAWKESLTANLTGALAYVRGGGPATPKPVPPRGAGGLAQQVANSLSPVLVASDTPTLVKVLVNMSDETAKKVRQAMDAARADLSQVAVVSTQISLQPESTDSNEETNDNFRQLSDYRSVLGWLGEALHRCASAASNPAAWRVLGDATDALPFLWRALDRSTSVGDTSGAGSSFQAQSFRQQAEESRTKEILALIDDLSPLAAQDPNGLWIEGDPFDPLALPRPVSAKGFLHQLLGEGFPTT